MSYSTILSTYNDHITTVTINRPKKLNALNKETIKELHDALHIANSDTDTHVILLTGSGTKAFVAGADISEFAHFSETEGATLARQGQELLFDFIENLDTPVIAAINGFALGGGLELAMAAHFRIASENAKMGLPEVSLGVIPGYGGTQRLPQLIGKGRAMELIMTAGMVNATTALSYGLVNHVVPIEQLLETAHEIGRKIAKNSPVAIASAIKAVNSGFANGENGYEKEIALFGAAFDTEDFKEGTSAFLEKRKANFPGK